MPSQSRPVSIGAGEGNGGTITGVPGTGAVPTMVAPSVSQRMPATGLSAMPVTGPARIGPTTPIGNGPIGGNGAYRGLPVAATIRPLVYQFMPFSESRLESPGGRKNGGPGGTGGRTGAVG